MVDLAERIEDLQKRNEKIVVWTGETKHEGYMDQLWASRITSILELKKRVTAFVVPNVLLIRNRITSRLG